MTDNTTLTRVELFRISQALEDQANTKSHLKEIVTDLKRFIEPDSFGKPTHSQLYEITSAAFNFKSRAALQDASKKHAFIIQEAEYDDYGDLEPLISEDAEDQAAKNVEARAKSLGTHISGEIIINHINEYFTPTCEFNECNCRNSKPVMSLDGNYKPYCQACLEDCLDDPDSNIGKCFYCSEFAELNSAGECSEHSGESVPESEEHGEAMEHLIEQANSGYFDD